jgi:hypothetical protein
MGRHPPRYGRRGAKILTDLEQKMQALQQRLELASVKASNGWTDMTINEIEKVRCSVRLDSTTLTRN